MSPRVNIHNSILSRCCHEPTNHLDMCGRPDCIWPCPIPIDNQQLKSAAGDKAFVLETSGATSLDFRQACSVESLAYRNPNLTVYLLMTGQYVESASMSALTHNYPNIIVKTIDLASYMTGHWKGGIFAQSGIVVGTQWPISVTLSDFSRNFAVAEDGYLVANGIIHADYRHPVIQSALYEFSTEYKWYNWIHNGPLLLTHILRKLCNIYDISMMTPDRCRGFQVLPPSSFFPIDVHSTNQYFNNNPANEEVQWDESVIAAHIYNKLTNYRIIYKNSNQLYVELARSSCPHVLHAAPNQF